MKRADATLHVESFKYFG